MQGQPAEPVAEEPTPTADEHVDRSGVGRHRAGERDEHCVGHGIGRGPECPEQRQQLVGSDAGGRRIHGELEQRWAGDAVTVRSARLDDTGRKDVVEPVRNQVGEEAVQLFGRRGGTRFVDVDELVGFEAEDVGERITLTPRRQQISDARERVAAFPAVER